ncbi:MAG: alpha/beta hydrolase [Pseudomonadota bacterium]
MPRHPVKWLIATLLGGYVLICLGACALQDSFAFFPDATPASLPASSIAQRVEIETSDGEQLVAFHAEAKDETCPTTVNFHGNAQHLDGLASVTDLYARNGMGFLAVAFRGYSGSTGRPSEAGVRRDGQSAYEYLIDRGVSPERIVVRGFSLGSTVAIGVAADNPSAALILGAPFESGTRLGGEQMPFLPVSLLASGAFRSDRLAPRVDEPVLIIHGDSDRIIPAAHSEDLAKAFPTEPTRIVIHGRGHNDLQVAGYESLITNFLAPKFPDCAPLQELTQ